MSESTNSLEIFDQSYVQHIMTLPIKMITVVLLKFSIYIISGIAVRSRNILSLVSQFVLDIYYHWYRSSFSTFHIAVILYVLTIIYICSTYNNICTVLDDMITGNWAGVSADLGNQVKTMMQQNGVVYNKCPLPAQTVSIKDYVLHLPKVPSIISIFASVRII